MVSYAEVEGDEGEEEASSTSEEEEEEEEGEEEVEQQEERQQGAKPGRIHMSLKTERCKVGWSVSVAAVCERMHSWAVVGACQCLALIRGNGWQSVSYAFEWGRGLTTPILRVQVCGQLGHRAGFVGSVYIDCINKVLHLPRNAPASSWLWTCLCFCFSDCSVPPVSRL